MAAGRRKLVFHASHGVPVGRLLMQCGWSLRQDSVMNARFCHGLSLLVLLSVSIGDPLHVRENSPAALGCLGSLLILCRRERRRRSQEVKLRVSKTHGLSSFVLLTGPRAICLQTISHSINSTCKRVTQPTISRFDYYSQYLINSPINLPSQRLTLAQSLGISPEQTSPTQRISTTHYVRPERKMETRSTQGPASTLFETR